MNSSDNSGDIMQSSMERQAQVTARIQRRKVLQAKLLLVLSTALMSGYATYTTYRYLTVGQFDWVSLLLLLVLATVVVGRWREV